MPPLQPSAVVSNCAPDRAIVVIPARLGSTRLPRKMLLAETGRPLVAHVWENARHARSAAAVLVVTDSEEIAAAVRECGGTAVLTSPDAPSGTARIVEALPRLPPADVIVNVQGDEPELPPTAIDAAIGLLDRCPLAGVATLVTPLRRAEDLTDPAAVKAVLTPWRHAHGAVEPDCWRAITFSRAPVPAARDWSDALLAAEPPLYWQHVGLYAYRRRILQGWDALGESRLAALESLEQLRLVEAGVPIVAGAIPHATRGIDTPRDYAAFVARQRG